VAWNVCVCVSSKSALSFVSFVVCLVLLFMSKGSVTQMKQLLATAQQRHQVGSNCYSSAMSSPNSKLSLESLTQAS
jgi:hypothetical protein